MTIYPSDHKLTMQERKACTEAFLHSMGIKTLATLPFIEDYIQARFRTPQTIARRALILIVLIDVAAGLITEQDALAYLKKYKLGKIVSPNEMRFLENPKREPKETNSMSWRAENINVLVWSLGYPLQLPFPTFTCSYDFDDHLPGYDEDPSDWIKSARLRNVEEILNELDLTYRMHWALVDARINEREAPAGMRSSIVYERHYALNWITVYEDDWDDITTDT